MRFVLFLSTFLYVAFGQFPTTVSPGGQSSMTPGGADSLFTTGSPTKGVDLKGGWNLPDWLYFKLLDGRRTTLSADEENRNRRSPPPEEGNRRTLPPSLNRRTPPPAELSERMTTPGGFTPLFANRRTPPQEEGRTPGFMTPTLGGGRTGQPVAFYKRTPPPEENRRTSFFGVNNRRTPSPSGFDQTPQPFTPRGFRFSRRHPTGGPTMAPSQLPITTV